MKIGFNVQPYNYKMRERRKELGFTQKQLAELIGCPLTHISEIETLKQFNKDMDKIRKLLFDIADILDTTLDELFPADYIKALNMRGLPRGRTSFQFVKDVRIDELPPGRAELFLPPPDEDFELAELKELISEAVETLPTREQQVIKYRYGLMDGKCYYLEDVASMMGVTKERIRQIEVAALTKLRHPSMSRRLRDLLR